MTVADSPFKKADKLIELDTRDLKGVFAKIKLLDELNRQISSYLDPNIMKYCQAANVVAGKIILIAANGSIATQIRFQAADLLRKIRQNPALKHVQQIECKVRPVTTQPSSNQTRNIAPMQPLSANTAAIVRSIAESLDDPRLREIMKKIAGHGKSTK